MARAVGGLRSLEERVFYSGDAALKETVASCASVASNASRVEQPSRRGRTLVTRRCGTNARWWPRDAATAPPPITLSPVISESPSNDSFSWTERIVSATTALLLLDDTTRARGPGRKTCLDPTGSTDTRAVCSACCMACTRRRPGRCAPRHAAGRVSRARLFSHLARSWNLRTPTAVHPRLRDGVAGDTSRSPRSPPTSLRRARPSSPNRGRPLTSYRRRRPSPFPFSRASSIVVSGDTQNEYRFLILEPGRRRQDVRVGVPEDALLADARSGAGADRAHGGAEPRSAGSPRRKRKRNRRDDVRLLGPRRRARFARDLGEELSSATACSS